MSIGKFIEDFLSGKIKSKQLYWIAYLGLSIMELLTLYALIVDYDNLVLGPSDSSKGNAFTTVHMIGGKYSVFFLTIILLLYFLHKTYHCWKNRK